MGKETLEPLFGNDEADDVLREVLRNLLVESDRGAVLVGAALVDRTLFRLLHSALPATMSQKDKKEMFGPMGPCGSLSARIRVAFAFRLISRSVHDAAEALRKCRNNAAHSEASFEFKEVKDQIKRIADIGPGMPVTTFNLALEMMVRDKTHKAMEIEIDHPTLPDGKQQAFATQEEFFDCLRGKPDLMKILESQLETWQFGLAVAVLCACIIHSQRKTRELFDADSLVWRMIDTGGQPKGH